MWRRAASEGLFATTLIREIILEFANEPVFLWLAQYAYQPAIVYLALIGMMLASGFGLPLPEEITIVSVGIIAYMGAHPDIFPPPYPGAPVVQMEHAAMVAFLAVFFSDLLVFTIGRTFGRKMMKTERFKRWFPETAMQKINDWTGRYGIYAAGIFRFTPGIRFPGHLACGMLDFSVWKFCLIDGFAALISVPTQIILIALYGEKILQALHKFKMYFLGALLIVGIYFLVRKVIFILKKPSKAG
jgi:membrane protein DedA with SNARE-associated domain